MNGQTDRLTTILLKDRFFQERENSTTFPEICTYQRCSFREGVVVMGSTNSPHSESAYAYFLEEYRKSRTEEK